jgi:hypothetical protein
MEKVVHKFRSFKEQEEYEKDYWGKASINEKFEAVETIRGLFISTFYPNSKKIEKVVTKRKLNDQE